LNDSVQPALQLLVKNTQQRQGCGLHSDSRNTNRGKTIKCLYLSRDKSIFHSRLV